MTGDPPPGHAHRRGPPARAARARPRPDLQLRAHGLRPRAHRQLPVVPVRRPAGPLPALPRPARHLGHEHHRHRRQDHPRAPPRRGSASTELADRWTGAVPRRRRALRHDAARRPAAGHRAHRRRSRDLVADAARAGPRLPHRRWLDLLPDRLVAGLRAPGAPRSGAAAGGGAGRGGRVRQGRRARLRALEGSQARRAVVGHRDRRGPAGLAHRVLGDEHGPPRARRSTSTPAASTWCSRTTRTRSPRARPRPGQPFVRTWLHCAHLRMGGEKMAKSTGNIARVGELLEAGVSPRALRYALIAVHYRAASTIRDESLPAAGAAVERIDALLAALAAYREDRADDPELPEVLARIRVGRSKPRSTRTSTSRRAGRAVRRRSRAQPAPRRPAAVDGRRGTRDGAHPRPGHGARRRGARGGGDWSRSSRRCWTSGSRPGRRVTGPRRTGCATSCARAGSRSRTRATGSAGDRRWPPVADRRDPGGDGRPPKPRRSAPRGGGGPDRSHGGGGGGRASWPAWPAARGPRSARRWRPGRVRVPRRRSRPPPVGRGPRRWRAAGGRPPWGAPARRQSWRRTGLSPP